MMSINDCKQISCGSRTCKPNSVCRIAPAGRSFLWAAHCCAAQATYPEVVTRRASRPRANPRSLPIWSCSVWGLPCPPHYCGSGALLPHLFTLTWHPLESRLEAVCFLWHFPSNGLESTLPDVIRHTALRSSDFPPSPLDAARATVRSSCQHFIIFDGTPAYGGSGRGADHANSRGDSRPRLSGRAIARLFFCNRRHAELRSAGQPSAAVPTLALCTPLLDLTGPKFRQ